MTAVSKDQAQTPLDEDRGVRILNHEDGVYYGQAGYIETATGNKFYVEDPKFNIWDISHALSMCVRYNGHVSQFYSVAEHCVLVSFLMENEVGGNPFEGLMHDALEAYLSDVPAPLKQYLPDYKRLDDHLDTKLREHFNLPLKKTEECKRADWLALFIEAYHLMPSQGTSFADPNGIRERALELVKDEGVGLFCFQPMYAEQLWLQQYNALNQGILEAGQDGEKPN